LGLILGKKNRACCVSRLYPQIEKIFEIAYQHSRRESSTRHQDCVNVATKFMGANVWASFWYCQIFFMRDLKKGWGAPQKASFLI
jgi:hypothetical protein